MRDIIIHMAKLITPIIMGNWKTTPATLQEAIKFVKQLDSARTYAQMISYIRG